MRTQIAPSLMVGWLSGSVFALALLATAPQALAAPKNVDAREMQAREAFGAARYQDALDLYVKLNAEKPHPNYLRNIGRCYQNLGDPDKAIGSFREYLRKAKSLNADERAEIETYIHEMEELKRQKSLPPPPPPEPVHVVPAVVTPPPPSNQIVTNVPPATEPSPPVYKRWWFWTAIGVAVVAGTVGVVASGALKGAKDPACEA